MTTWWDDYNLPTIDSISGADLMPVYSQQNGAKRNVSAENVRTFMQQNANPIEGGILSLSSVYAMQQSSNTSYSGTVQGTEFRLDQGLSVSTIVPAGRDSITLDPATGGFYFNRDCQAVSVVACIAHNVTAVLSYSYELLVKIEGVSTYTAPLRVCTPATSVSTSSGITFSAVVYNPNNANNIIKRGEVLRFYGVRWSGGAGVSFTLKNQYFSVQTLDGV
jgi:hypothetical protein